MRKMPASVPSLDELATQTVRLGRDVCQMAQAVSAAGEAPGFGAAAETLQRLGAREAFEAEDSAAIRALADIVAAELGGEIVGYERRFVDTHYDEDGPHGELREFPCYSPRGDALLRLQESLRAFVAARDATLDRVGAERATARLLQG